MIYLIIYLLAGIYTAYFTIKTEAEWKEKFEWEWFLLMYIIGCILIPPAGFLATVANFERKYWRFI